MIRLTKWLRWQPAVEEAKEQLEKSKAEKAASHRLVEEVNRLHEENRISARVHAAMRGGRA